MKIHFEDVAGCTEEGIRVDYPCACGNLINGIRLVCGHCGSVVLSKYQAKKLVVFLNKAIKSKDVV